MNQTETTDRTTDADLTGFLLGSADRPVILVQRLMRATPDEVWSAWTEPDRAARWIGAIEAPLTTPGAVVRVAMAESEVPTDFDRVENPATFTVREADAPTEGRDGRLVLTFDDRADPGGQLTVTMRATDDGCLLTLRHSLTQVDGAIDQAAGFGAGWEGFLDWLEAVLATGAHGDDDRFAALLPLYERRQARLALVRRGSLSSAPDGAVVRHERSVNAPVAQVWKLVTTPDGLERWLGRVVEGQLGPGERVVLVQDVVDPDHRQECVVTAWDPPHRMAMSWAVIGGEPSVLSVELTADRDRTRLVLEERALQEKAEEYLVGWQAHLDVLVAEAEGFGVPSLDAAFVAAIG